MLRHLRLHKERGTRRVNTGGNILGGGQAGAFAQGLWVLGHGNSVHIGDKEQALVGGVLLQGNPVVHRANIVAQMHRIRGRLRTGVDTHTIQRRIGNE